MADNKLPDAIDLALAQTVTPPLAPEPKLDPLSSAGVDLAKRVLWIITACFFALVALLVWGEAYTPQLLEEGHRALIAQHQKAPSAETAKALEASIQRLVDARKAFREFWFQFAQMILLNLLLPVLTAILGYIFGSRRNDPK